MNWDSHQVAALVRAALEEDIGSGDATTAALLPPGATAKARILAKQDLVVAGLPLVERVFRILDPGVVFYARQEEGQRASSGDTLAEISGTAAIILSGERTALNFLGRLCGVATLTRKFVEAIAGTSARIRDTRKTTPSLRSLEKYAVRMGGGVSHRFGLFDAILIKENHIALAGGVAQALARARDYAAAPHGAGREMTAYEAVTPSLWDPAHPPMTVQIEVRHEADLRKALAADAEAVLLDNLTPAEAARLTSLVRRERPGCIVEISGGITLANARAYAECGADFLSSGSLTHSAPAADVSLLVESLMAG